MTFQPKTELQRLLHERQEDLLAKRKKILAQQEQLAAELKQLDNDIVALNEALNVEARATGQAIPKLASNGSRLLGLRLGEAIRILRQENPKVTKRGMKHKLLELGFDFKGKRPGSAVHMAWVAVERWQKHKDGERRRAGPLSNTPSNRNVG